MTHQHVFDYHEGEVYWCTADVGWVTGHSYIVMAPGKRCHDLIFEGVPNYPTPALLVVCDKHQVNIFYRSYRDPSADGKARAGKRPAGPACASSARWASRSTGSLALVPSRGGG